jgi:hypothetical protein
MKKNWWLKGIFPLLVMLSLVFTLESCTKAQRDSYARRKAAENGKIERHVIVRNSLTDRIRWEGTGIMNLENSSDGDYEILLWEQSGSRRVLFNGRFNDIVVEDLSSDGRYYHVLQNGDEVELIKAEILTLEDALAEIDRLKAKK